MATEEIKYEKLGQAGLRFVDVVAQTVGFMGPVFGSILLIALVVGANNAGKGAGVATPVAIIIAAIGVLIKPRFFAYVVSIWLLGIVVNLLLCHQFYDIALRDFGLSLGALALGRLAAEFVQRPEFVAKYPGNLDGF